MKILFTKTGIEQEVSEKLGNEPACFFKDFIEVKTIRVEPFELKEYTLIFTSQNAVKAFFENEFQIPKEVKIYTVGEKTTALLLDKGYPVKKTCKNAEELGIHLLEGAKEDRFLHFCGTLALETLERTLKSTHSFYKKIEVYETVLLMPQSDEDYDAIVFFSPSGVRSFAAHHSFEEKKLFAIGKTTENEVKNYTQNQVIVSDQNTLEDLLNKIKL